MFEAISSACLCLPYTLTARTPHLYVQLSPAPDCLLVMHIDLCVQASCPAESLNRGETATQCMPPRSIFRLFCVDATCSLNPKFVPEMLHQQPPATCVCLCICYDREQQQGGATSPQGQGARQPGRPSPQRNQGSPTRQRSPTRIGGNSGTQSGSCSPKLMLSTNTPYTAPVADPQEEVKRTQVRVHVASSPAAIVEGPSVDPHGGGDFPSAVIAIFACRLSS